MTVKEMRKRLVGRTIVGFKANAFRDGEIPADKIQYDGVWEAGRPNGGNITYNPVLILDDGTEVRFETHETQLGCYGIDPRITPKKETEHD